jgi:hypothetical protein
MIVLSKSSPPRNALPSVESTSNVPSPISNTVTSKLNLFVTGALAPAKYVILTFSQYVNELFKGQNKKTPFKKKC